ncbi:MAG TPA: glycoside hydrolase family 3 C-terminal domain-containing protein [Steroidobacteraceae bacterium]
MTLDEKIALIHGATEPASSYQGQAGYMPGVPRLGIAALRLADGPPGVLTRQVSSALPSTLALAASFSRADALANGVVIGRDARDLGIDVVLEPFINLYRDPAFSRSYNTYGEDPLLTGQIGAAVIRGIQSQGVMAEAKHFVAFDGANDVRVDAQTLHEIYAAPFADAVSAGVASVMCAYNKVNGQYACGSEALLNGVLRDQLGFRGFVTSDWGATHAPEFINAGLDLEMPGELRVGPTHDLLMASYFSGTQSLQLPPKNLAAMGFDDRGRIPEEEIEAPVLPASPPMAPAKVDATTAAPAATEESNLRMALRAGRVSDAAVTQAARRILQQMQRFGLLTGHSGHALRAEPVAKDAQVAERTAEDSAVLLKNDGALPLTPRDLTDLLLVGPGALQTVAVGKANEQALGRPERQIGALPVLQRLYRADPSVHIRFCVADDMNGHTIPAAALSHDDRPGLVDEAAASPALAIASQIDFTQANGHALPARSAHHWIGQLQVPATGAYDINLQLLGASGEIHIDGHLLGHAAPPPQHGDVLQAGQDNVLPTPDGLDNLRRRIELSAGRHALSVSVRGDDSGQPLQVRLNWSSAQQQRADYQAAIAAAQSARAVVVFAWSRNQPVMALPGEQDQLIRALAERNANTIVVLNTSDPVVMPWLNQVRAVLQLWYTGDEGGWAAARLLTGRVSPAGRLPVSWPKRLQDSVAHDPAHPERSSAGVDGHTVYSEGLMVGYRWFDQQRIEPLFPFGYGLSYARFDYRALQVRPAADGGLNVAFTVRNTSDRRSDEVPQVYLSGPARPPPGAQFAPRSLVAFTRIGLAAGQTRRVSLHVALRQLQYWDPSADRWALAPGARELEVGASSRDIRLRSRTEAAVAPPPALGDSG